MISDEDADIVLALGAGPRVLYRFRRQVIRRALVLLNAADLIDQQVLLTGVYRRSTSTRRFVAFLQG